MGEIYSSVTVGMDDSIMDPKVVQRKYPKIVVNQCRFSKDVTSIPENATILSTIYEIFDVVPNVSDAFELHGGSALKKTANLKQNLHQLVSNSTFLCDNVARNRPGGV